MMFLAMQKILDTPVTNDEILLRLGREWLRWRGLARPRCNHASRTSALDESR
jgi:hypothetical protein